MGTINVSSEAVERAIQDLLNKGEDLTAPMKSIGEEMINSTQQRFRDKEAPDGTPWADNSPVTEARKGHGRVLEGESNELAKQFSYSANSDSVEWGSLMIYGPMMYWGGTKAEFPHLWGDIPGREFVGLSDDDEDEVLAILADHLTV
ncbi:phage virion morphogenesis (putative tail completion) protein [Vreelandella titanicae]|uniref:phage virion morphogenesis protein n=1 Tax=Vreelandella titanicae TaxID=664683 RepID=UPI000890F25C|nr:phage virion morphogenesis protein [Halomonas titanicae]SDJ23909.1 phage virion morphogenesis (putative tail completion) protein [Halomonas titanicae]